MIASMAVSDGSEEKLVGEGLTRNVCASPLSQCLKANLGTAGRHGGDEDCDYDDGDEDDDDDLFGMRLFEAVDPQTTT